MIKLNNKTDNIQKIIIQIFDRFGCHKLITENI